MELSSLILYLSDRHTTHTRVQYTCPCIGTHLAGKREPFPPSNTVGLHRLPVRTNHKDLDCLEAFCKIRYHAFVVLLHVVVSEANNR